MSGAGDDAGVSEQVNCARDEEDKYLHGKQLAQHPLEMRRTVFLAYHGAGRREAKLPVKCKGRERRVNTCSSGCLDEHDLDCS